MADITKCDGVQGKCKLKDSCFRYLAKDSKMQSYFLMTESDANNCEYYWKCTPEKIQILNKMWRD